MQVSTIMVRSAQIIENICSGMISLINRIQICELKFDTNGLVKYGNYKNAVS